MESTSRYHRYFARQPKPQIEPGLDYHAIGGPQGFLRYDPVRHPETVRIDPDLEVRWHRLDCCPVWRDGKLFGSTFAQIDALTNPYAVIIKHSVMNQWQGSHEWQWIAKIWRLADGGWFYQRLGAAALNQSKIGGASFPTLLSAIRAALRDHPFLLDQRKAA